MRVRLTPPVRTTGLNFCEAGVPGEREDLVKEAVSKGHPRAYILKPGMEMKGLAQDSLLVGGILYVAEALSNSEKS